MSNNELEVQENSMTERDMLSKIKQFFLNDKSEEGSKLLVKEKRRLMQAIQSMKKDEEEINLRKDFTIAGITNYAFQVMNLPVDNKDHLLQIYQSSLLLRQSYARGKKCATPKVRMLSQVTENQQNPRIFIFEDELILQIEIEFGARLVLTTDGKFPEEGYVGCEVIFEANYQRRFTNRCVLRIKAQKDGMLDSDCVSFELRPKNRPGDEKKIREYHLVKKSDATFHQSNSIQQSEIFFPL